MTVNNIENNIERENDSNLIVKHRRPKSYNKPTRRQALLEIRRLIVEEGLSHNEIQLRLNLPPATYFRYLDILFQVEQEAIEGNNYTYQRLWNETLILAQRYLRRVRRLEKLADDREVDGEVRRQAEMDAAELERAVHDMTYFAPSYLHLQGLLPDPEEGHECLRMTKLNHRGGGETPDEYEKQRLRLAGAIRQANIIAREVEEQERQNNNNQNNNKT